MATRAEVVELKKAGRTAKEIAEALSISVNGVYNHIKRAKVAGELKKGKATRSAPVTLGGQAGVTGDPVIVTPGVPSPLDGEHPVVGHIRAQIADAVEHLESEMHLKREEIKSLERQHGQLYHMLTTPLPDATEE